MKTIRTQDLLTAAFIVWAAFTTTIARGADPVLTPLVLARIRAIAPAAELSVLHAPPVLGAALLALDAVAPGDHAAADRVRSALADAQLPAAPDIA